MNERIKAVRKAMGLTQQAMADALNLKRNTIGAYEVGVITPSDRTIADICQKYNVDENWLRTGEGDMFMPCNRRDELAAYMGKIIGGKCTDMEEAVIAAMARTSVEGWKLIEKFLLDLMEEMKKPS